MDRGAWQARVHGVAKSWIQLKRLNMSPLPGNLPGGLISFSQAAQTKRLGNNLWWQEKDILSIQHDLFLCICLSVDSANILDAYHIQAIAGYNRHTYTLSRVRLCNPMACSLPGSSVHGISQARILEWVAISFSTASS